MITEDMLLKWYATAPLLLVKLFAVILMFLHMIFSIVLVRQTKLMTEVVEVKISSSIYAVSIIHLLASVFVLIWAIFIL